MAEERNNDETPAGQPPLDAGTPAPDAATAGQEPAPADAVDYKAEVEKLQNSYKELQGQFTTVSQEAARTRQLLDTVQPYIDYSRLQGAGAPPDHASSAGGSEADDETYLSSRQVQELLNKTVQDLRGEIIAQNVRMKYPDVCDGDWKEVIVRSELAKLAQSHPYDDPQRRIEKAVAKAREILTQERTQAKQEAAAERQKADEEAKKKAAAAASAAGLQATGTASPARTTDETKPVTPVEYTQARQQRRQAREAL